MAVAPDPSPGATALADLDRRVRPLALAGERALAVAATWNGVLPGGIPRGSTLTITGPAARSCAFSLLATTSREGSWVALVGLPGPGWAAMAELGVVVERVVCVTVRDHARGAECVAAALDGFDAVCIGAEVRLGTAAPRRLAARARERGTVLVGVEEAWSAGRWVGSASTRGVPGGLAAHADITITTDAAADDWDGVEHGHGHLRARRVHLALEGRRLPGRRRADTFWLPTPTGTAAPAAVPFPRSRPDP